MISLREPMSGNRYPGRLFRGASRILHRIALRLPNKRGQLRARLSELGCRLNRVETTVKNFCAARISDAAIWRMGTWLDVPLEFVVPAKAGMDYPRGSQLGFNFASSIPT